MSWELCGFVVFGTALVLLTIDGYKLVKSYIRRLYTGQPKDEPDEYTGW